MKQKIDNNQKGFSQVAIFITVGLILISFAVYSYIPVLQNAVKPNPSKSSQDSTPIPSSAPALTEKQELLIKHKAEIMKDLNLTEEQFIGIVKMASDPDFDY